MPIMAGLIGLGHIPYARVIFSFIFFTIRQDFSSLYPELDLSFPLFILQKAMKTLTISIV
jgi:hypothetical protein